MTDGHHLSRSLFNYTRMVVSPIKRALGQCRHIHLAWRHRTKESVICNAVDKLLTLLATLLKRRLVKLLLVLILLLLLVVTLHTRVLPNSMGYYHQDCVIPEARRERMRQLLKNVVEFFNEENATYWLDFGTLLGVMREGDIMAHDGDMDVSRLADDLKADRDLVSRVSVKMRAQNMRMTALTAKHQDTQVDLFRWQTTNASGRPLLKVYYPFIPAVGWAQRISEFLLPPEIPQDVLFPLRQVTLFGVQANIPRRPLDLLKIRYPLTWWATVPYKWKCWVGSSKDGGGS